MRRPRPASTVLIVLFAAAALVGCSAPRHATEVASEPPSGMSMIVDAAPGEVMVRLQFEARSQGGAIVAESADSFSVDFGVHTRRVTARTGTGPADARAIVRETETEVHEAATYSVRAAQGGGTLVTIAHTPTWWHPDLRCWLPGPRDSAPPAGPPRTVGCSQ